MKWDHHDKRETVTLNDDMFSVYDYTAHHLP
jgi:hypothetical protein